LASGCLIAGGTVLAAGPRRAARELARDLDGFLVGVRI